MAVELRHGTASIHEAAGDRATLIVAVLIHRLDETGLVAVGRPETVGTLHDRPAVVQAGRGNRNPIHLFDLALPDVCDPQVGAIERPAPRVAQAEGPHLGRSFLAVGERVVVRDAVRRWG